MMGKKGRWIVIGICWLIVSPLRGSGQSLSSPYGNGTHASILDLVEEMAAMGLVGSGAGEITRYRPVTAIEYHDGSNWVQWDTEGYKNILDGNLTSDWHIDAQYNKFRFIIDLQGKWRRPSNWVVITDWGGSNPTYSFTVESSDDQSNWTTRVNSQTTGAAVAGFVNDTGTSDDRYIRLTFDSDVAGTDNFNLKHVGGFSKRIRMGEDPIKVDYDQNYLFNGNNVGIGTSNPSARLTVNGKVKAQEIIVEENVGADFVFRKDYPLMSFEELEKWVVRNQHLPGISSAETMKKEGVKIGELQIKLLQKVEELTLHMIQMNKRMEKLEKENKQLKEKVNSQNR